MDKNSSYDFRSAKKAFSRVGIALIAFFVATIVAQYLFVEIVNRFFPTLFKGGMTYTEMLIVSSATMYLCGFPVFWLCLRNVDRFPADESKCSVKTLITAFVISMTLMYFGQMLGDSVSSMIYRVTKVMPVSETIALISQLNWVEALIASVIIGPFFEELMFRKIIIDRTRGFGEKISVIFSALMFAFFHMSVLQFFYAFFVGLLYGYIYVRKGRMLYSYILHAVFNFFGSVLPLILTQFADYDKLFGAQSYEEMYAVIESNIAGYGAVAAYGIFSIVLSFVGINLLFKKYRTIRFERALFELPKDSEASTAFVNVGVILFISFAVLYPFLRAIV